MKYNLNNKGFSLIEIIVTLSISCVIVLAVYSFIFAGSNSYKSSNKQTNSQQEMSYVNKLLGGKIKAGSKNESRIYKSSSGDFIYDNGLGYVFSYEKSKKSIYIFEKTSVVVSGSLDIQGLLQGNYDNKTQLVSKYIDNLELNFVSNDVETDPATGNLVPKVAIDSTNNYSYTISGSTVDVTEYLPATDMVQVVMKVVYKGNNKNSDITYTIRNE